MAEFADLALVQTLAGSLLHFLWQGAFIALAAAVLLRVTASARVRYTIGICALLIMVVAPIATFAMLRAGADVAAPSDAMAVGLATTGEASRTLATPPDPAAATWWPAAGVLAWLAGIAILSIRLAGGWLVARRMATHAVRPAADHVQAVAAALADQLELRRVVRVLESSTVAVPVLVGWLRPAIIFPVAALAGLSPAQIEALIAHELAHVRRHDYLVNLLQSFAEVVLFYHPAVWWLSRRIRIERELCCDDEAVGVCDRLVYATALTDLAAMRSPEVALAATGGDLLARVRRILGKEETPMSAKSRWIPAVVASAIVVAVPVLLASVRSNPQSSSVPEVTALTAVATVPVQDVKPAQLESAAAVSDFAKGLQQMSREELEQRLAELTSKIVDEASRLTGFAFTGDDPQSVEQRRRESDDRARQAEIEAARKNLERVRRLFETGLAPQSQVAEAEAALQKAEAGNDRRRQQASEIEAMQGRLEDMRRRFETGLVSRDQLAALENALAQAQAGSATRQFMQEEMKAAQQRLERSRQLFERGLMSQGAFAEGERRFRSLQERLKAAGEFDSRTLFDRLKSGEADSRKLSGNLGEQREAQFQQLHDRFMELQKNLMSNPLGSRGQQGNEREQAARAEELQALLKQYEQMKSEYERALRNREDESLAYAREVRRALNERADVNRAYARELQRSVESRREVPPEPRERAAAGERGRALETPRDVTPEARREATETVPSRPIQAGDTLFVAIDGENQLPTTYRVESNGNVRLPLLGSFKAIGQTPGQLREAIGKKLMDLKLGSPAKVRVEIRRAR